MSATSTRVPVVALTALLLAIASGAWSAESPLGLAEAIDLALEDQPMLDASAAGIRAARERAVADAELPDPKLELGVQDFPVEGRPAFTFDRDDFTMLKAGFSQEFTRAGKRRLRGRNGLLEAEAGEQELAVAKRAIRRDAGLAWVAAYFATRAHELTRALAVETETRRAALEIALRVNQSAQADVLAADVERALVDDRARALERDLARARATLARWIGSDQAGRPLAPDLPQSEPPPPLEEILAALRAHPHLGGLARRVALADNATALAWEDYKPDWRVSVGYGYRPAFSDFVGVQLEIDLPLFPARRQDRRVAERLAEAAGVRAEEEDALREHVADVEAVYADWRAASDRLAEFDAAILPLTDRRVEAAQAAYETGRGTFSDVLAARRARLETQVLRLAQQVEIAAALLRLRYFW